VAEDHGAGRIDFHRMMQNSGESVTTRVGKKDSFFVHVIETLNMIPI
jgi:hypothetical protein